MIGLVLVSHSARLAQGVAELAAQMGGPNLRIALAGGLDQPEQPLGTDAALVARAIEEVWSDDGVLVLMDLGSAVLSAEMALDLLSPQRRAHVLLTAAPLVEGAVAAAVAAGLGESLERAAEEAGAGLVAKAAHLAPQGLPAGHPGAGAQPAGGPSAGAGAHPAGEPSATAGSRALRLTVQNPLGLHARPAALFVRTAGRFDSEVLVSDVTTGRGPVNARSLSALATLGVGRGHEILVEARGAQADEALVAIESLAGHNFGDPPDLGAGAAAVSRWRLPGIEISARPASRPAAGSVLRGLPGSPGVAVGEAQRLQPDSVEVPDAGAADPEADWAALQRAVSETAGDIRRTRDAMAGRAGEYEAAIFDAHLLLLADEALLAPAREHILRDGMNAARAWATAVAAAAAAWETLDDSYQRARAVDLRSVGDLVLRHILGRPAAAAVGAGILVAPELTPAEIAALDRSRVAAVACAFGGPASHAAILARALGIPAAVMLGPALLAVPPGTRLALDGEAGTVIVDPSDDELQALEQQRAARARRESGARRRAHLPAVTRDGTTVRVSANVSGPADAHEAVAAGADGVGLLRTELLFLGAGHLPTEDEQERAYRAVAETLAGRHLTLRTLDAGADKQLPYLALAAEQNPNLGLRGIRLGLSRPELLLSQLRAALRVAVDHPLRILLPMVSLVDEVRRARELLDEARASLAKAGTPVPKPVELGVMIEVPAAALMAESFVPYVDFFSVGTNDLAQYVLAADRGNAEVAALANALHPAVLRLIDSTVTAAAAGSRPVAVCGELAADPLAVPLLVGLGIAELSMSPARIPLAKQAVRETHLESARELARRALAAGSAGEVRHLLQQ